ncbi:hypothetical protein SFB3_233G2, partial [Candidatus Arthromitus sp. SFB-3]
SSISTLIKHGILKINSKERSILPSFRDSTYTKNTLTMNKKQFIMRLYMEMRRFS